MSRFQVYNNIRNESVCANLSSVDASIVTPRGPVRGSWSCSAGTCGTVAEHDSLTLTCPGDSKVASVAFASFGLPEGSCAAGWAINTSCNAADSLAVVQNDCVGRQSCTIPAEVSHFNNVDPCVNVFKTLAVSLVCTGHSSFSWTYSVEIPVGSVAEVHLPKFGSDNPSVSESGTIIWQDNAFKPGPAGISQAVATAIDIVVSVGSGSYTFIVNA